MQVSQCRDDTCFIFFFLWRVIDFFIAKFISMLVLYFLKTSFGQFFCLT